MKNLSELKAWHNLVEHQQQIANEHMRNWFEQDNDRFTRYSITTENIFLDYSRNRITEHTLTLLEDLANTVDLSGKIEALFQGKPVNSSENRPALHTALRDLSQTPIIINGENIADLIADARDKMAAFVEQIHTKQWLGVTGKPIKHIVNIGIGGSHLGPMMCSQALQEYAVSDLSLHYLSSVDDIHLRDVLKQIDPETSLFIISSKSFTTIETLTNANTIIAWMKDLLGEHVMQKHFVAVTAAPEKAIRFGIDKNHIFPTWEWVGGRYSVWSAIGLPLMLFIGNKHFTELLAGAHAMDQHFRRQPFTENQPMILAMLNIWYMNFFHSQVQAIIPYSHRLKYIVPYLQQAEMESTGKHVDLAGDALNHASGPVLFGEEGSNGQHAYHQLLHQGQQLIPVDFILVAKGDSAAIDTHQDILFASCLSQAQALMRGKTYDEAYQQLLAADFSEKQAADIARHQIIPGNKPSNIILIDELTPRRLGALMAMYEHRIFVQSVIWDINPFDQWGVELGKQLLPSILVSVKDGGQHAGIDSATQGLITRFRQAKGKI